MLLACHLLRDPAGNLSVTLIEKRSEVGRGVAYCTANPDHLLNVRACNMSAFPISLIISGAGSGHAKTTNRSPGKLAATAFALCLAGFIANTSQV